MKPSIKLHSIAFALATTVIFILWTQLNKLSESNEINDTLKILIGLFVSLGAYRLFAKSIIYLTTKSNWIKKQFLGQYYLEGTWVGFYIGASGHVRFLIEKFEQDIDNLTIRGKSFNDSMEYHANWISSSVNIDIISGRISYLYEVQSIIGNSNNNGIAFFNFDRKSQYSEAKGLNGFSADLHIGKRVKALEIKLSDSCDFDEEQALKKAVELYKINKDKF